MIERTTVRLPQELLRRAKRKAAAEGRTLTSLIEDGLRLMVTEKQGAKRKKRILPRISSATGGLLPGVDLTRFSDYQEMEDLEYIERMKHFNDLAECECPRLCVLQRRVCVLQRRAATSALPGLARPRRHERPAVRHIANCVERSCPDNDKSPHL